MNKLQLIKPLEKTIKKGHPWIFRDALEHFSIPAGEEVSILSEDGNFCCKGLIDDGPIGVRVYSLKENLINKDLFSDRLHKSFNKRKELINKSTNAVRLCHGESDFLPGLIIDKYDTYAVMYFDGNSLEPHKETIFSILEKLLPKFGVENLLLRYKKKHEKETNIIFGSLPNSPIIILENGMKLFVDLINGQKTGMFLDHRDSRLRVKQISKYKKVLNLYAYTGGFSISAGLGGALDVTTVDIAPQAIVLAEKSWEINGLSPKKHNAISEDVPVFIKETKINKYDLIIADPPSFAPNKNSLPNALKAYTKLHSSIFRMIAKGGIYIAASCSSHVDKKSFEKTIKLAAKESIRNIQVLDSWGASEDHPIRNGFPEGNYLKVYKIQIEK